MTKVISLARPRAAHSVQTSAQNPTFKTAPASPVLVLQAHILERQQAIENALSMALFLIRQPLNATTLDAATGRAIRAASMLKQACAELTICGRA